MQVRNVYHLVELVILHYAICFGIHTLNAAAHITLGARSLKVTFKLKRVVQWIRREQPLMDSLNLVPEIQTNLL